MAPHMNFPWFKPPASAPSWVGAFCSSFFRSADVGTSPHPFERAGVPDDDWAVASLGATSLHPASASDSTPTAVQVSPSPTTDLIIPPVHGCGATAVPNAARGAPLLRLADEPEQLAVG